MIDADRVGGVRQLSCINGINPYRLGKDNPTFRIDLMGTNVGYPYRFYGSVVNVSAFGPD
jgi:hypothetical protein